MQASIHPCVGLTTVANVCYTCWAITPASARAGPGSTSLVADAEGNKLAESWLISVPRDYRAVFQHVYKVG
jgi:hypothetical protein